MTTPMPENLPSADQKDANSLDVRVLAGEWESAALVVNNITDETLDGRVSVSDFVSSDGKAVPGWDVLRVRTAPAITVVGSRKRDPLPALQEGGLFRVSADENELLWLTFKSHGLAPGRYKSALAIRSLDDRLTREVELVLRVYPLPLGAEGRPAVNVWNYLVRGKDMAERAQNCKDYYISAYQTDNRRRLPRFTADADGNVREGKLDFGAIDADVEFYPEVGEIMRDASLTRHRVLARSALPAQRHDDELPLSQKLRGRAAG